jgi:hypothetical protein
MKGVVLFCVVLVVVGCGGGGSSTGSGASIANPFAGSYNDEIENSATISSSGALTAQVGRPDATVNMTATVTSSGDVSGSAQDTTWVGKTIPITGTVTLSGKNLILSWTETYQDHTYPGSVTMPKT